MILVSLSNPPGRMVQCSSITWNPPAFKTLPSLLSLPAMHVAARPCTQRCFPVPLTTIQQTSQTYCGLTLDVIFLRWQNYPQLLPPLFATQQDLLKLSRLGNNTKLLHKINGQTLLSRHCPSAVYIGPPFRWLPSSLRALVASKAETLGHQSDGLESCGGTRSSNEKNTQQDGNVHRQHGWIFCWGPAGPGRLENNLYITRTLKQVLGDAGSFIDASASRRWFASVAIFNTFQQSGLGWQ